MMAGLVRGDGAKGGLQEAALGAGVSTISKREAGEMGEESRVGGSC